MMRLHLLALVLVACSPAAPVAPPASSPPTAEVPDAPIADVVEYQLEVDGAVVDVDGRTLPHGFSLQRAANQSWSGHGVSLRYPDSVRLVAEDLAEGAQITTTDGAGSTMIVIIKPYTADLEANLNAARASVLQAFATAQPFDATPVAFEQAKVFSYGVKAPASSVQSWGVQLAPDVAIIASLTVPIGSDGAALIDVLRSLRLGARPATPMVEIVREGRAHGVILGEAQIVDGVSVRVLRRSMVLRRWKGLAFEHDPAFVVSEVVGPMMLSLQLTRPSVMVQFFLTKALEPHDARAALLMAFPDAQRTDSTRVIGGIAQQGSTARQALINADIISEVYAWKVRDATVGVLIQYDADQRERAEQGIEMVLGSLSVTP